MDPKIIRLAPREIFLLRKQFEKIEDITAFDADIKFASKIASYGIFREIGTVNDELARFIFDVELSEPVRLDSLNAELVEWNGLFGLRVFSTQSSRLELRAKGFYAVVHPGLSVNKDGTLHSLFIFPEIVNRIARAEGVELVLVKSWGANSIFGGFDPAKGYYQTNYWEIENNDALKFSDLIRQGKLAFMGTHDLIAHIVGVDKNHWPALKKNAARVYDAIDAYFKTTRAPSIASLILPYTIGVVLDDLAQPPSYSSEGHLAVLNELLLKISNNDVPANWAALLMKFPQSFQKIIELSRVPKTEQSSVEIKSTINLMVKEILAASVVNSA